LFMSKHTSKKVHLACKALLCQSESAELESKWISGAKSVVYEQTHK